MSNLKCGREVCIQCGACTPEEMRENVQNKAKEMGHCLCSPVFECACNFFKKFNVCKCANEECDNNCDINDWISINSVK